MRAREFDAARQQRDRETARVFGPAALSTRVCSGPSGCGHRLPLVLVEAEPGLRCHPCCDPRVQHLLTADRARHA